VVWDATADRARAERDSWVITYGEPHRRNVLADYATLTGRSVTTDDLLVQASRWDLTEVALYAARFSRPHADDEDGEIAWAGFTESLSTVGARESAA
jgi:hypothetical protein